MEQVGDEGGMGWLMQEVLSVRGAQTSASGSSGVLQRHGGGGLVGHRISRTPDPKFSLPPARALIEGSARDPQPPTAIAPTGTEPRRSVVVARP